MNNSIKFSICVLSLLSPFIGLCQEAEIFDFITIGQNMEVVKANKVSKETLSFDSPIDSLKKNATVIREYYNDGREISNTYLLDNKPRRSFSYEYSMIYPKVKVCSTYQKEERQNCYDLILSEDTDKIYKTLENGFTPTTYEAMSPPFDIDKKYKPAKQYFFIKNIKADTLIHNAGDSANRNSSRKPTLLIKEEISYKIIRRNGLQILFITTKQWRNKKRKKEYDRKSKIEFDPINNKLNFYVKEMKNKWILEKVQSYNKEGLFIGKEVFPQLHGMKLGDSLMVKKGERYMMEVFRNPEGLATKIHEYINGQVVYITNYDYEYYD